MNRHRVALLAGASALLFACSTPTSEDTTASEDAVSSSDALRDVTGPTRLRGRCAVGGQTFPFEVDAWSPPEVLWVGTSAGPHGAYSATVEVSLGFDHAPSRATLRTVRTPFWLAEGTTSSESHAVLGLGGTIALEDPALLDDVISCAAELVEQRAQSFTAVNETRAPLDAMVAPRLQVDVQLPGTLSCGVALRFDRPLAPTAVEDFRRAFAVSANAAVTLEGDRTLALRLREATHAWTAFMSFEAKDHATPIGSGLRAALHLDAARSPIGAIENIACGE